VKRAGLVVLFTALVAAAVTCLLLLAHGMAT